MIGFLFIVFVAVPISITALAQHPALWPYALAAWLVGWFVYAVIDGERDY